MEENQDYLTKQIITYIGNKRKLLTFINKHIIDIKQKLNKNKLNILDGFSGTGIVSRYFKQHSNLLITNDLEQYSQITNECFLTNKSTINHKKLQQYITHIENIKLKKRNNKGIIQELYAPNDENDITKQDRVFYTIKNATIIDNIREELNNIEQPYKNIILSILLAKSSVHANTSGVFKGFYKDKNTGIGCYGGTAKNCLSRITSNITIEYPVLSNFECDYIVYKEDINKLVSSIKNMDIVYYDPPYNQHPYGSNYFMLNLISSYIKPKNISKISGIPVDWTKSTYNKKNEIYNSLNHLISNTDSKYILLSYNTEGFISLDDMFNLLKQYGNVSVSDTDYNVFRGCRNLKNRNHKVKELLFTLETT